MKRPEERNESERTEVKELELEVRLGSKENVDTEHVPTGAQSKGKGREEGRKPPEAACLPPLPSYTPPMKQAWKMV